MRTVMIILGLALAAPAVAGDGNPQAGKVGGSDDPVVCKREVPIGSLIATRKVCLTKKQWEERRVNGNEEARKQMLDNMAKNPTPSGD